MIKKIYIASLFIALAGILLTGANCKKNIYQGTVLNGLSITQQNFQEFSRDSWRLKISNTGKDLTGCSIALNDKYVSDFKNIQVSGGFLGGSKLYYGTNNLPRNMKIEIQNTSDFDQNEIFINQETKEKYNGKDKLTNISIICDQGSENFKLN